MNYEEQAEKFLSDTGTSFKAELVGNDFYFDGDKESRDIYRITFKRRDNTWSFRFGQSIAKSKPTEGELNRLENKGHASWSKEYRDLKSRAKTPTAYDVLACVTKYNPGSLDDFAAEYGYSNEKPSKLLKTYSDVVDEYRNVRRVFGDVMEQLEEIQ